LPSFFSGCLFETTHEFLEVGKCDARFFQGEVPPFYPLERVEALIARFIQSLHRFGDWDISLTHHPVRHLFAAHHRILQVDVAYKRRDIVDGVGRIFIEEAVGMMNIVKYTDIFAS